MQFGVVQAWVCYMGSVLQFSTCVVLVYGVHGAE